MLDFRQSLLNSVHTDRAAPVHELPLLLTDYGLVFTWITVQGRHSLRRMPRRRKAVGSHVR